MKALLLCITFFAISTLGNAQLAMNTSYTDDITVSNKSKPTKKKTTSIRTTKTIQAHNQSSVKQLTTYLSKQLQYSKIMQNNGMEGKLVIEVSLSKRGSIINTKIVQSLNDVVDKVVIEAMSNLKSIQCKNNDYHGSKKILIPIDFTI